MRQKVKLEKLQQRMSQKKIIRQLGKSRSLERQVHESQLSNTTFESSEEDDDLFDLAVLQNQAQTIGTQVDPLSNTEQFIPGQMKAFAA